MADSVQVTVKNGAEIEKALKQKIGQAEDILAKATAAGAELLRAEASQRAQAIGRQLSENIISEVKEKSSTAVEIEVGPDKDRFWGLFFEFGTDEHLVKPQQQRALKLDTGRIVAQARAGGIRARPWLRPAFDENSDEAIEIVGEQLQEALGL